MISWLEPAHDEQLRCALQIAAMVSGSQHNTNNCIVLYKSPQHGAAAWLTALKVKNHPQAYTKGGSIQFT